MPLLLPPLRERASDVLELADNFLADAALRLQRPLFELEPEARQMLAEYHWPGNVRELQNIITRACVLNQDAPICASELRPWLRTDSPTAHSIGFSRECPGQLRSVSSGKSSLHGTDEISPGLTLEEVERELIVATMERCGGHRAQAARALGIGLRTLSGKLRSYGYAPREKDFAKTG